MTVTYTTNLGLAKQDAGETGWDTLARQDRDRLEARLAAQYAGDPNGLVAGYWVGQPLWDTTNDVMYICTTATGVAGTTVWSLLAATIDFDTVVAAGSITLAKLATAAKTTSFIIACSDETTALTTGTAKATFRMPFAFTLTAVRCTVTTAPTGANLQVDINEGGGSILSTVLSIDAGEKTSTTAVTAAVISDSSLADDAEITIDIDQVGSTVAGAGLKVELIGYKTA